MIFRANRIRPRVGLTLLELLVCVAVLAIVASAVVPAARTPTFAAPAADPLYAACRTSSVAARTVMVRIVRRDTVIHAACYPGGEIRRSIVDVGPGLP
jgi:prepilin-type N-terminal cleavage/methylation domain-containing protein